MDQPQRGIASDHSNNLTAVSSSQMPHVLFREIHKNAFLKKHSSDRRAGFPRKSERVWVVFCVHDDVDAFLEIYPDQKVALTHKPEWFTSLANALHVSPSICGHEDEFEFAVTLSTQVIRLAAPSWESMMEWVDTIRNKLRELKVLSPKENLYSKMPEQKQPLLPTRDPNSPLPLPPDGPSTLLPGVEPVHLELRNSINEVSDSVRQQRDGFIRSNISQERRLRQDGISAASNFQISRGTSHNNEIINNAYQAPQNQNNHIDSTVSVSPENEIGCSRSRIVLQRTVSVPESSSTQRIVSTNIPTCSNITVIEVLCPSKRNSHSISECSTTSYDNNDNTHGDGITDDVFEPPSTTPKGNISSSDSASGTSGAHYEHVFLPNTVVRVDNNVLVSSDDNITLSSNQVNPCSSNSEQKVENDNSSQEDNTPCSSSSINISNDYNNPKKFALGNVPKPCVNFEYRGPNKCEESNCISQQVQSKLEKVTISGLIPRVPAKSSKHDIGKRSYLGAVNINMNGSESTKYPFESGGQPSSQVPSKKPTEVKKPGDENENEERGNCSNAAPAYSQVKKVPKGKIKTETPGRNDEIRIMSPITSRRKVTTEESQVSQEKTKPASSESVVKKTKNENLNRGDDSISSSNSPYRNETNTSGPSTSGNVRNLPGPRETNIQNSDIEPLTATVQPAVNVLSVEDIPLIGGHQRRRRRSSSSDAATCSNSNLARGIGGADRIRINVPVTHPGRDDGDCRIEAEPTTQANPMVKPSARLTLREQQVLQLRKEMKHPGGVRLQLRRKECIASIALVDVLSRVWIAGWKQREHPMLYNALHIGDQLISVSDVVVRSAADAQKIIRTSSSFYIELIIRRVPFGRVFALHRSSEGQSLGIIQEGNTAEIRDVVPNSVAARAGLPSKTPSTDGISLTTWYLTEVNGRPLNLFFKDNEVRDRLNAVGKDISILVQPHDFIKQIKKNLKNIKSYKDYIVQ